jgi:hypothetical protein
MPTDAPPKPLTVQLPVCEICERVGKIPGGSFRGHNVCIGPVDAMHPRRKMKLRKFVEQTEESS